MKFAFYTLGCKVNLFETQGLMQIAVQRGHEIVSNGADAVIINTCTVTSSSDHKNLRAFHKMKKENPDAVIAACGCFSQANPEKVMSSGQIDLLCGTQDRTTLLERCEQAVLQKHAGEEVREPIHLLATPEEFEHIPAGIPLGRTRALLKIEDGCNNFCSYCIIPYVRGRVRSLAVEQVLEEALRLQQQGTGEIVLTGIDLSAYGTDIEPAYPLYRLVGLLLQEVPEIRFRLGSLDPRIIDEAFCSTLSPFPALARHFHLSLQSGSDTVLQRMNRKYTTKQYARAVDLLRENFPDCAITTDLIVGFPGETTEEFEESLQFMRRCAFASVHVFPFSRRQGTLADRMPEQIEETVKESRAKIARELADTLSLSYRRRFLGKEDTVLPERSVKSGFRTAHGLYSFPYYIKVVECKPASPVRVRIGEPFRDGVLAEVIESEG